MSFADRGYDDGDDFLRRGWIVKAIIVATVLCYFLEGFAIGRGKLDVIEWFGVVPSNLFGRLWLWQGVTHAFLHDPISFWHIAFNMLFLYWFGTDLAVMYGARRFAVIYFGGAVCCALLYGIVGYAVGEPTVPAVGASGAIMSVMVIAAFLFPHRRMLFMWLLPVPLWFLVVFYIGIDVYYPLAGLTSWLGSAGHLGGAAFGLAFYTLGLRTDILGGVASVLSSLRTESARADDGEVDRILGKIKEQGMGSLTDQERESLMRASKRK